MEMEDDWRPSFNRIRQGLDALGMDIKLMKTEDTGIDAYALVRSYVMKERPSC